MKFAVIQFPGSNCDQDCIAAINSIAGLHAEYVWHKETSLRDFDAIVLPGGFAYGDYLRCGAIARFSPIMQAVVSDARAGKLVLGTCNGFQILRYSDRQGRVVPEANPNGSIENIAGICNHERNVFGLMPHPDRASDARLGSADGAKIFRSMMETINANRAEAGSGLARQVA